MTVLSNSAVWKGVAAGTEFLNAYNASLASLTQYANAFFIPFTIAANYFNRVESRRLLTRHPLESMLSYFQLGMFNMKLAGKALNGDMRAFDHFMNLAHQQILNDGNPESVFNTARRMDRLSRKLAFSFPSAIESIKDEFGFHFDRQPASSRVDETDRFILYQVLPSDPKVQPRPNGKPILIVPPFVLGANILAFLPNEKRSYVHAFANQGFPTYVRILKDIQTSEAVQLMGPEEEVKDMQRFSRFLKTRHGVPVTLNGYCQGGFAALYSLLSGELDGLVDAFITCVSPIDGSRSRGMVSFLKDLPQAFNDLEYGTKILPNGNQVVDGTLMSWIYKLKNIESETPLLAMWRDVSLLAKSEDPADINKTAAALYYWLLYDRGDLPLKITRMSFDSYNSPIQKDGTLPVKLFGRTLNILRLREKRIPWLICYGKQDDLVEPASALAPVDFVEAEVTGYPKGHVAIATSWSHPESAFALHQRYPEENTRGPVRFQIDLQNEIDQAAGRTVEERHLEGEPRQKPPRSSKPTKKTKLKTSPVVE